MIRYFEVLGLGDEVDYFGFMDTSVDRIVEIGGQQFFGDYAEFKLWADGKTWISRLDRLIPERMKRV